MAVQEARLSQPVNDILRTSAILALLLLLASLAAAALIARHISRNVDAIANAANDLGGGKAVTCPPVPFREAHSIANALAAASEELRRRADIISSNQADLEAKVTARTSDLL